MTRTRVAWGKRIFLSLALAVLLPVVLVMLGTSCEARYTDVSQKPGYAERVGQRCTVLRGLRAHGVTLDPSAKEEVTNYVAVTPLPGIGGREITFDVDVPKGTRILVTGVRSCSNCPFGRIDYAVEIPELMKLAPHPVFAYADALAPDQVLCAAGGQ